MITKMIVPALETQLIVVNTMASSDRQEGLIGWRRKDIARWMLQYKEHWRYL